MRVNTDAQVWRDLLAPASPLVKQPPALEGALIQERFPTVCTELRTLATSMDAEHKRVVEGVCLYYEHLDAIARRDYDESTLVLKRAQKAFGGRVEDLRRLGSLLMGVAKGKLTRAAFVEASDLCHGVLEPDAAQVIMRRIKLRRRGFVEWLRARLDTVYFRTSTRIVTT